MANFDYLKAQIAARIHDNTEQEITAEDVRRSFNDTIDAINAAKEDEGAVAPAAWGGITGTLSAQTDLQTALNGKQATIADLGTIRSGAAAGATAYQKPSGGIPKTDLNNGVQSSLNKADSAYQKPGTGIPKGDLASGVQTSLGKADTAYQKPSTGIPGTDLANGVRSDLNKARSAVQPSDIALVASTGSYNDLLNKPTIPAAPGTLNTNNSTAQNVSSSEALSGTVKLHKVSKTGSYNDLTNKPTIPAAQVQSDWNEADNTKPAFIKNKPAIPPGVTVDQVYDATSANAQSGVAMAGALAGKEDTISDLSTIRSGAAAGATAVQPGALAAVATSGQYSDLTGTPTIPAAPGTLDTTATTAQATSASEALSGSVVLHKISKTGKYSDLSGKPTVPVITLNGSTAGTPSFYAPTSAGTAGQVLVSTGGAPTWQAAPSGGGDVTDVTLGGTSVVDGNGVAVLPAYPVVPTLATVATTGDYDDLLNKPNIPTVPTISTDIATDAASDTKTASPKAVADYVADSVVGVTAPVPNDGTIVFTHRSGDTDTVDLNHVHPQYAAKVAKENSQPAGGMLPNTFYNLGTLSGAVTFLFAAPDDNTILNEYMLAFDSGSPAASPTWPASITGWQGNCLDNGAPLILASKHYEVSVTGGYGLIVEF